MQAMLALPEGDEEKFIASQAEADKPIESQSARQVQQDVKQWKEAKSKKFFVTVANEFYLFTGEDEVADWSKSVGESEWNIVIENESTSIQNPELNLTPTEESEGAIAPAEPITIFH